MASKLYFEAMDEEARTVIQNFFEFEDWILRVMDRHDINTLARDDRFNMHRAMDIPTS